MITVANWKLAYEGFSPDEESLREALCTLGNGYFATRGAAEWEAADAVHYPGTYLAGGFNRLETNVSGRMIENEDLVNLPNWLPVSFRPLDGDWLNLRRDKVTAYRQELDIYAGVLRRRFHIRDKEGRETSVESRRFVSMHNPHLAALQMTIRPENWSGEVELMTALDGRVVNGGVARYRPLNGKHLMPLQAEPFGDDGMLLVVQTSQSCIRVAEAARTRFLVKDEPVTADRQNDVEEGYIAQRAIIRINEGEPLVIEKSVALYTGRDNAISEPALAAVQSASAVGSFQALFEEHARAWQQLWNRCDITLKDSHRIQMILHLHIFHLLQTVSLHSCELDVGVPARGLHGEAYRGHIFWDEVFILPFLNFRMPEISRALLLYRYRRLPAARAAAKASGLKGALYPWQSGSSGREESQVLHLNPRSGRWTPDNSSLQRHVNAAIALNVCRYYEATGDHVFMSSHGAEMLVEIARLWVSLTKWDPDLARYVINGVVGPDEFHDGYPGRDTPGLDNNAYTNVMAAWVLTQAQAVLEKLPPTRRRELDEELGLTEAELAEWDAVSRKLFVPFHGDGIISQFSGYERLEELDWDGYRAKYGDIQRLDRILEAEGDSVNGYQASKQADVLMLFYLLSMPELRKLFKRLGYTFNADTVRKCISYYLSRTSDGSTLSRLVHSWVVARSDRKRSWKLFMQALESDVSDVQGGTTAEGIHLGAMAGTVDLVQRGQTALEIVNGVLHLSPCMPHELQGMRLRLVFQGSPLTAVVSRDKVVLSAPEDWAGPHKIGVRNRVHPFRAGDELEFDCQMHGGGWRPLTHKARRRTKPKADGQEHVVASDSSASKKKKAVSKAVSGAEAKQ